MMDKQEGAPSASRGDGTTRPYSDAKAVQEAFAYCENLVRAHYENFPVASRFLPRQIRPHVCSIYAYARGADDIADEGDLSASHRLALLDEWEQKLDECYAGAADDPVFIALGETVAHFKIPRKLLADLLVAFRMDVTKNRFATYDELLGYCTYSANPVGRLVLHLFGDTHEGNAALSDNMCSALQLANFWQDVSVDLAKGRIYLPLEDLGRFGYTEQDLQRRVIDERFERLVRFQVDRTRELFRRAKALCGATVPNLRLELRLTWRGGMKMLDNVERLGRRILLHRPQLSTWEKFGILLRSAAGM